MRHNRIANSTSALAIAPYLIPNGLLLRPRIQYPVRLPRSQLSGTCRDGSHRPRLLGLLGTVVRRRLRIRLRLGTSLRGRSRGTLRRAPGTGTDCVRHLGMRRREVHMQLPPDSRASKQ